VIHCLPGARLVENERGVMIGRLAKALEHGVVPADLGRKPAGANIVKGEQMSDALVTLRLFPRRQAQGTRIVKAA
jgi:hypothetical protein